MNKKDLRQVEIARGVMDRYDIALSVLAQGETSPLTTDDFRARLEAAAISLEKYKSSGKLPD